MRLRTLATVLALVFLVGSLGHQAIDPRPRAMPAAQAPLADHVTYDLELVARLCRRWAAGPLWTTATAALYAWHLLGERKKE